MNDSFLSVVKDRASDNLLVRARTFNDLNKFVDKERIFTNDKADYRFRAFVSKDEFAKLMKQQVDSIDYDNFKNSVKDRYRKSLYERVWEVLFRLDQYRVNKWYGHTDYGYDNGFEGYNDSSPDGSAR